jgi:hypothetical protein
MNIWLHIKIWLIVAIASIFLVMAVAQPEKVYENVQGDLNKLAHVFGRDSTQRLVQRTNGIYDIFFGHVAPAAKEMHVTDVDQPNTFRWESNLTNRSNNMLRAAKIEIYHILLRVQIMLVWMPFILLFCAVAFFDGLMMRKVKIASFRYTNPALYNSFMHAAIFIAGSLLLLLHLPVALSIWFFPLSGIALGFCLMFGIMNLQRMGT